MQPYENYDVYKQVNELENQLAKIRDLLNISTHHIKPFDKSQAMLELASAEAMIVSARLRLVLGTE